MLTRMDRRALIAGAAASAIVPGSAARAIGPFCVWVVRTILVRGAARLTGRTIARQLAGRAVATGSRRAVARAGKIAVPAGTVVAVPSDAAAASAAAVRQIERNLTTAAEYAIDAGVEAAIQIQNSKYWQLDADAPFIGLKESGKIDPELSTYSDKFRIVLENTDTVHQSTYVEVKIYDFDRKDLLPVRSYSVSLPGGDKVDEEFAIRRPLFPGRKTLVTFVDGTAVSRTPSFYVG